MSDHFRTPTPDELARLTGMPQGDIEDACHWYVQVSAECAQGGGDTPTTFTLVAGRGGIALPAPWAINIWTPDQGPLPRGYRPIW